MTNVTTSQRFWAKVQIDPDTECWVWTAASQSGYGVFSVRKGVNRKAHRWAYEQLRGEVPDGLQLDHLCRNRLCVNPDHLEPVTGLVNIRRSPIHNGAKTHCKSGHEFTPENSIIRTDGARNCRECQRESNRKCYAKSRGAA